MKKVITAVLTAALALSVAACDSDEGGGDEKNPEQLKMEKEIEERRKRAAAKKASGGGGGADGRVQVTYKNNNWKVIERAFTEYRSVTAVSSKNIFSPNSSTFIKRPELPKEPEPSELPAEEAPKPVEAPKTSGLEAYELKDYKLIMIVSGTTVNRALVLDPKGKQYFVERGFRIGNKGARVQAITQYTVFVQEPDSDKPVKLDIEPPFIGLESKPDGDEPESTVVPKTDLKALFKGLPAGGGGTTPIPPSPGR